MVLELLIHASPLQFSMLRADQLLSKEATRRSVQQLLCGCSGEIFLQGRHHAEQPVGRAQGFRWMRVAVVVVVVASFFFPHDKKGETCCRARKAFGFCGVRACGDDPEICRRWGHNRIMGRNV